MDNVSVWVQVLGDELRFLSFRPVKPDLARHGNHYLILGLAATWLAGIGRYWDHPSAEPWQYFGLGSIAYAFVLTLLLYLVILPLKPLNWTYRNVLTFVGMTAPPAFLYAIPVERFYPVRVADTINIWFLLIVAVWRVVLLVRHLRQSGGLPVATTAIAMLLPLSLIVTSLTVLNLEKSVFEMMAGNREHTAQDGSYAILLLLTVLSVYASPFLLAGYLAAISARRAPEKAKSDQEEQ